MRSAGALRKVGSDRVTKPLLPFRGVLVVGLIVVTCIPCFSTLVPGLAT